MTAKSVAKNSGTPDFKEPNITVKGPGQKVPTSGTNDFDVSAMRGGEKCPMGRKVVKSGGGDASDKTNAYSTIKKASGNTGDSNF